MSQKSSIPKKTVYEIVKETEKAALLIYEETSEENKKVSYVFFIPKVILENKNPKVREGFFANKKKELQDKVPFINVLEERGKAVKVSLDIYSDSAFWIPKNVFKANYDENAWNWIRKNKLTEFDYSEIIEYENSLYSKVHATFIPNKWIIEISGRYYVENGKLEWITSKKQNTVSL